MNVGISFQSKTLNFGKKQNKTKHFWLDSACSVLDGSTGTIIICINNVIVKEKMLISSEWRLLTPGSATVRYSLWPLI